MKPWVRSQPSPTHDGCAFFASVRPSTDCAEYDNARFGCGPAGGVGTFIGTE
ncbi:hypothetical protein HC031_09030 [Planosporangium thailandense]|uniref:Uncharacterized protein n=1 Tax=Planosporangium thailandense TaxID=765197 RepID=A0ABX0XXA0_9ACTN|nr:hypothetical protein [Planosporangium thailandense]NJC69860.1 hypothetical protein [Planosporangium thailandense]